MVNEKQTKRERNIKSKLMAAIAMLLVSSIMMVSTTYAWFTLSTAPEVTGIQTAVGANGNLEMALLPMKDATSGEYFATAQAALDKITSGNADSFSVTNDKTVTNITWGNLVDLDHASYGMSKITLYPSTLATGTNLTEGSMLNIPVYGNDGRVANFTAAGTTGTYDGTDSFYPTTGFGVRAVGKVSGLSARETAYNTAMNVANAATSSANTAASESLNIGGNALASLAMKHAQTPNETFTDAEILPLSQTYEHLLSANGAITKIETALRSYIKAYVIQGAGDEDYAAKAAVVDGATWTDLKAQAPAAFGDYIDKLIKLRSDVEGAKSTIDGLIGEDATDGAHKWEDIYDAVKILGDTDSMLMNEKPLAYWLGKADENGKTTDDEGNAINVGIRYAELLAIMNSLTLEIKETGVYVGIADFCGKITGSVQITLKKVAQLGGQDASFPATMVITPSDKSVILPAVKGQIPVFKKDEGSTVKNPISDFYGYIVDLAFRTNAVDSYLKLQTEAEDRIYRGNTANADTMGSGSTMSYTYLLANESYNGENVKKLMSGIRVVFFDPTDSNKIIAYAKLDMNNVTQEEKLDASNALLGYTLTAKLKLTNGNGGEFLTGDTADKLINLNQNVATALSALVYLDGANIGNEAVSNTGITGTMNLQFSSSATLKPMEYSDLRNGSGT